MRIMVLEVAIFDITDPAGFEAAYLEVREVIQSAPGCRSVRMTHGIEDPNRFVLLVEWDSVEAHETNFRTTDRFVTWRGAISPFFAQPPLMQHFTDVS
jgi:heme-degrading monooxygenase HmoA